MARVDFYVLGAAGESARLRFACRLAEKAYRLKNTVHIQTADQHAAEHMDELLWTYNDGSFLPHEIKNGNAVEHDEPRSPITISQQGSPRPKPDLFINLAETIPAECASFPRVAEIVTSDDGSKQKSRKLYAKYREMGHTLETHKL